MRTEEQERAFQDKVLAKAGLPSVIKRFSLRGVNGYKDIELNAERSVKILVAENGAGKTTLLNALYSIISGNYKNFLSADFREMKLQIGSVEWNYQRDDLAPLQVEEYRILISNASVFDALDIPIPSKFELEELFILNDAEAEDSLSASTYFSRMSADRRFSSVYLKNVMSNFLGSFSSDTGRERREAFVRLHTEVVEALNGAVVLYLPTYRRIEASFPEYMPTKRNSQGIRRHSKRWAADQLIHFGLQDVEARLDELGEEIRRSTVQAFSEISGRTLDDLLTGSYQRNIGHTSAIDVQSLHVVLGRLGRDNVKTRKRLEAIIQSGEINQESNLYLKSFLDQLLQTYKTTQNIENLIESFIEAVNSYWDDDESEKRFQFDKGSAEATVRNSYTNDALPLSSLSSGEKQIVSIFSRLYLEQNREIIVLIDEPELSLSIDWQKKLLPDMIFAPNCRQIVSITHSPFIFKNTLNKFANALVVRKRKKVRQ